MKRWFSTLALAAAMVAPAMAGELQGVELAPRITIGDHVLALNGMALRKVTIVKVYVAGLYLPKVATDATMVLAADAPRHMEMAWLRGASEESVCEGWLEGLEANTPSPSAKLEEQFQELCSLTGAAEKDDRFTFTYLPGEGTTVAKNGEAAGKLAGKAFADALFACWIGPDPGPGQKFKQQLMGG